MVLAGAGARRGAVHTHYGEWSMGGNRGLFICPDELRRNDAPGVVELLDGEGVGSAWLMTSRKLVRVTT